MRVRVRDRPGTFRLYEKNFGLKPTGDIRKTFMTVPSHDILCAGFPCQPFSKAGDQKGFDCPQWGDLFDYVIKILDRCAPKYILIENVPNLMRHADGETWKKICRRLRKHGYAIDSARLSPTCLVFPKSETGRSSLDVAMGSIILVGLSRHIRLRTFPWIRSSTFSRTTQSRYQNHSSLI